MVKRLSIVLMLLILLSPSIQAQFSLASPAQTEKNQQGMIWSVDIISREAPYPFQYFQEIKAYGYNTVEIDVPWADVEVGPNEFNFTVLDQYARYTERLNLGVIFLLIYGDDGPIPAFLLKNGELEVNPNGQTDSPPYLSWWNATDRFYFLLYLKAVIERYNSYPNVRGYLINYGYCDDGWGPPANGLPMGYSRSDVKEYLSVYLPSVYKNITALNEAWKTHYLSFSQISAPGPDYQQFRIWSMFATYSEIYSMVRNITNKELFLYYGGSPEDAYALQFPYIYFSLAKKYNVTIILDDADQLELAQMFSGLAKQYGVGLMMEWTPSFGLRNRAYYAYYLSHLALAYPYLRGEDYWAWITWPNFFVNSMAIHIYSLINGTYLNNSASVLPIFANVYVVKDGVDSYAVLNDESVPLGSQTASINLSALGYSPSLNYNVLNFNTGELMPSSSFVVNFHGLSGTMFLGIFPTHLNSSLTLRYAGSVYNSTVNASEVRLTGYSSEPGRIIAIVSSGSFSTGLISYEVGVKAETISRGNFSLTLTLPPLINGSYSVSGYLLTGGTVVGAYRAHFSVGVVKRRATAQLWPFLMVMVLLASAAAIAAVSFRSTFRRKRKREELKLKAEGGMLSAKLELVLTRDKGLELLNYLKSSFLTSNEFRRQFSVREEPVIDERELSLKAKLRFPPYELENEQEVRVIMEGSGGTFYPSLNVTRISGDPSRWQALAKRFIRQLASKIEGWTKEGNASEANA